MFLVILYPLISKVRADGNLSLVPSGDGLSLESLQWPTLERDRRSEKARPPPRDDIDVGFEGFLQSAIDVAGQKASETFQITNQAYNDLLITIGKQEAQLQFLTTKLKEEVTQIQEKERQMKIDMQKMKKKTKTQYTQTSIALTHHPECSVCMEKFSMTNKPYVLRECGHSFCQYCIHNLHKSRLQSCPMCRTKTLFVAGWVHPNYVAGQYETLYGQRISGFVTKRHGETKSQRRKSGRRRREEQNVVGIPQENLAAHRIAETLSDVAARGVSPQPVAPPLERLRTTWTTDQPLERQRAVSPPPLERQRAVSPLPLERQRASPPISQPVSPPGDGNIFSASASEWPSWATSNWGQVEEPFDLDDIHVFVPALEAGGVGSWYQLTPTEHFALRAHIQHVRREREWTDADQAAFIRQVINSRTLENRNSLEIPSTSSQIPRDPSPPHFLRNEDPDPD